MAVSESEDLRQVLLERIHAHRARLELQHNRAVARSRKAREEHGEDAEAEHLLEALQVSYEIMELELSCPELPQPETH